MTARVLVRVTWAVAVVCAVLGQPNLRVVYPHEETYNMVKLSCRSDFGDLLNDAEFFKRVPGQGSPEPLSDSDITLTQAEEGYFSCSSGGSTSSEIGLAGKLWYAACAYMYN